jgi:hypothetical protein
MAAAKLLLLFSRDGMNNNPMAGDPRGKTTESEKPKGESSQK